MRKFNSVYTRSALRVGLAGGGTDIKSYFKENGGAVINFAIKKFHHIYIRPGKKSFSYINQNTNTITNFFDSDIKYDKAQDFCLISSTLKYFKDIFNVNLIYLDFFIYSDAPRGSGLGASSSLVVGLVSSLATIYGIQLNFAQIAHIAYTIEREMLNLDGGSQDQYVSSYGGLNFIEFLKSGEIVVSPLILDPETKFHFESRFISFFTGISRSSEEIIKDQRNSINESKKKSLMNDLTVNAYEMKNAILLKQFDKIPELLNYGFNIKKKISSKVVSPEIEEIIEKAKKNGAMGLKISGAGGGGFISCYVNPNKRGDFMEFLSYNNLNYFNCNIHSEGIISFIN
jgi:D-glycero-alpha-D-manno-heptose-7-phosphate kinase